MNFTFLKHYAKYYRQLWYIHYRMNVVRKYIHLLYSIIIYTQIKARKSSGSYNVLWYSGTDMF